MTTSINIETLRGDLKLNEPLANYTSWRVGGPADRLYRPADLADLKHFINQLPENEPIIWLGLGSNTLVRDKGFRGTVIITQGILDKLELLDETHVRAEAGLACGQVARFCARHALRGSEFLAGIPGTIGGALRMNAGAYGGETWDYIESVEVLTAKGEEKKRIPSEYTIAYRTAISPEPEWFLAATFKLIPGNKEEALEYIRNMLAKRNAAQPTNLPNCGSVFRNPPNDYAARLIESCDLKGYRIGGACVSTKHANFIVNDQHASAADIEHLIAYVHTKVLAETGVDLLQEVHVIGEN